MKFSIVKIQEAVADAFQFINQEFASTVKTVDDFILASPMRSFILFLIAIIVARIIFFLIRSIMLGRGENKIAARKYVYRFFDFNLYYLFAFSALDIFNVYLLKFDREDFQLFLHVFRNILALYVLYINIGYFHSFLSYNFKVYFKKVDKDFIKDSKKLRYVITITTFFYILLYNLFSGFFGHNIITVIFFVIYTIILLKYDNYAELILPKIVPASMLLTKKHISKYVILYVLPVFLYLYTLIYSFYLMFFLANNDKEWAKNLLSGILEQHLESLRDEVFTDYEVPSDYVEVFKRENGTEIMRNPDPAVMAYERIDSWLNGTSNSYHLAFSGESGSGKNHALDKILKRYSSVTSFKLDISEKILEESVLLKRLENFVGKGSEEEKKFVIIKNAHNLFLSKFHGFKAFDAFFNVINNSSKNVFWFTVWNSNSLNLIKHIYNRYELSTDTIYIRPWNKEELKELILKRHEPTGLEIRFNEELFEIMSHFGTERSIENAHDIYFRILAKQTGGNPQAAVNTWLKSISHVNDKTVEIHLPQRRAIHEVEVLSDESLFVFSSILSHEYLSFSEIVDTTDLSEKVVTYALKAGFGKGILSKDGDYFYIRKDWLVDIKTILQKRNFIYE
ncbi:hypothetical protein M902_1228 [Bacteriovorax sp. BAL6_X]|uniref:hypothetical protein n=1 Tax=Bacteriovorax sp. BAL6_X TaxID=1201290 RepID=UPI000386ACD3|nr:hypothetical protein [Bacteriovorax sp. BAL6_X]EPZ49326.1 hypothetical protein M902_1228 [Bacteriovorax sp. BAL6_X]